MNYSIWRRCLALALWFCGVLGSAGASAQVLFLSTTEPAANSGQEIVDNAYAGFAAQATARGLTMVDRRGALSGAASIASEVAAAQLVVVVTVYNPSVLARLAEITSVMAARPDLTVLAFLDGCCSTTANIDPFVSAVNTNLLPSAWPDIAAVLVNGDHPATLNATSPYAGTFSAAGLSTIVGGYFGNLQSVPTPYALYSGNPLPAAPGGNTNAYGFFLPHQASANGSGACLFMTGDSSPFSGYYGNSVTYGTTQQWNSIASAFTAAALDPAGACTLAAAGVPDLVPTISGSATPVIGVPTPYQVTVSNTGPADSTDGTLTVTMPAGMTVLPASLPATCTANVGNTSFTCTLPGLAAGGGSTTISFQAVAAAPLAAGATMGAQVTGVTGEIDTADNSASLALAAVAPVASSTTAVPTLDIWALLGLSALLPWLAARRRRAD